MDGERDEASTGITEKYVAGRFDAEPMAKLFAKALEMEIAEGAGFVVNRFTPRVSIFKIESVMSEIKKEIEHYDE